MLRKFFKSFFALFLSFFIIVFQLNLQVVYSSTMDIPYKEKKVTEELRLKVSSQFKKTWLEAEEKIWEPWLSNQDGFLGRQIFWDKEKEEALILVNWRNKKLWKSISTNEVNKVQEEFEESVKSSLKVSENPFKLIYEGELEKQE